MSVKKNDLTVLMINNYLQMSNTSLSCTLEIKFTTKSKTHISPVAYLSSRLLRCYLVTKTDSQDHMIFKLCMCG